MSDYGEHLISMAGGDGPATEDKAVDAAIAAVRAEHGDWFAGIIECELYRPVLATAVNAALKAAA